MLGMFNNCSSLRSLDLPGFNTANVTQMSSMFEKCSSLRSLDLSSFNTRKVAYMQNMFQGCTNLESIDLSSFDTENMKSMTGMFFSCTKLETLDLSSFATPKMVSMVDAFSNCKNLKTIYVTSAFTTDKVTLDFSIFDGCVNLPNYNPNKTGVEMAHTGEGGYLTAATASWVRWDAPTGTLSFHRSGTKPVGDNILDLGYGDDPNWDTHAAEIKKVVFKAGFRDEAHTTCSNWFNGCTNLTSIEGIENLNTSKVTDMSGMFAQCSNLETLDLSHFNTEKVTTMAQMFYGCTKLHDLNIDNFNTENVSYMNGMFDGCSNLESLDLSHFNTRYVRKSGFNYMFNGCSSLSSLDVSNFITDKPNMQLKWREVIGFKTLYGTLTDKNNPFKKGNQSDLFEFPSRNGQPTSFVMGDTPYMELNVGIHNIFKILRVDYVRRLNYLNAPNAKKNGVRFVLQFDF